MKVVETCVGSFAVYFFLFLLFISLLHIMPSHECLHGFFFLCCLCMTMTSLVSVALLAVSLRRKMFLFTGELYLVPCGCVMRNAHLLSSNHECVLVEYA